MVVSQRSRTSASGSPCFSSCGLGQIDAAKACRHLHMLRTICRSNFYRTCCIHRTILCSLEEVGNGAGIVVFVQWPRFGMGATCFPRLIEARSDVRQRSHAPFEVKRLQVCSFVAATQACAILCLQVSLCPGFRCVECRTLAIPSCLYYS